MVSPAKIPQYPEFVGLSLIHQKRLQKEYNGLSKPTSHRLFSNLFITDTDNTPQISSLYGNIIVDRGLYKNHEGLMLLGENMFMQTLAILFENGLSFVELSPVNVLTSTLDQDNSDYIYAMGKTDTLLGSEYEGVRRKVRKCVSLVTVKFAQINDDEKVWSMYEEWELQNSEKVDNGEKNSLEKALQFRALIPISYVTFYVSNKIVGFCGVEDTSHQEVVVHFFKSLSDVAGLSEFMFHTIATLYKRRCDVINFQQDLGIQGLRRFKTSLRPVGIRPVYTLKS